jgi:hypothetical protein
METFNYKDDKFSIRPQAPPGGETHFSLSDSGYGDKNIYHPHKRNNHPSNDINPPPNFVKKEQIVEATPNGAPPVTGNRPSIKLRAPPGGYSSLDYYSEENNSSKPINSDTPITQNGVVCDEPQTETKLINESDNNTPKPAKSGSNSKNSSTSSLFSSDPAPVYKPYYAPQAPPGGKSSISFGSDADTTPASRPKPRPNPEFQESMFSASSTSPSTGRRTSNQQTKQNNQTTFNSSFFGSSAEEDQPYKPYYAPQAPPGGKDSISFGSSEPDNTTQTSFSGRRRNYNRDHFKSSINFNY